MLYHLTKNRQEINKRSFLKIGSSIGAAYFMFPNNLTFPKNELIDVSLNDYINQLRWAFNLDLNASYIHNKLGYGIQYSFLTNSIDPTDLIIRNSIKVSFHERNKVHYIAPSFTFTTFLDSLHKYRVNTGLSIGYVSFISLGAVESYVLKMHGASWGANIDLGGEIFILENLSVGIKIGYFFSMIPKVRMLGYDYTFPKGEKPILSNINLNASFNYYFSLN